MIEIRAAARSGHVESFIRSHGRARAAIHVFLGEAPQEGVDARAKPDKPGHDDEGCDSISTEHAVM